MEYINEPELRKAIELIKSGDNRMFELRIIPGSNKRRTRSGYFKSIDQAVYQLKREALNDEQVYIMLNPIDEALYSRTQRDKFVIGATATSDADITGREWILVDFDPARKAGVSSTNEELKMAANKCVRVHDFLKEQGFSEPVSAMSGNGYHLLYKVDFGNDDETTQDIVNFLSALDELFTDDEVKIDKTNSNLSRVCKLYGTLAQKGSHSEERPFRMSRLMPKQPAEIKTTDIKFFKKIGNIIKREEKNENVHMRYNGRSEFDVEDWMSTYGLRYRKTDFAGGTKYILDCCPFNSEHRNKDAAIIKRSDGTLCFHCFHNSCSDKGWRDVRLLFEPDAYDKKYDEEEYNYSGKSKKKEPKPEPVIEVKEDVPLFYTLEDINKLPRVDGDYIKTGIDEIDKATRGLKKDYVSVWSGLRASGKSTLLLEVAVNVIDKGRKVTMYSGEQNAKNLSDWVYRIIAGKGILEKGKTERDYNCPDKYRNVIAQWVKGNFLVYNNKYGHNFKAIVKVLKDQVIAQKTDLLILDNLMSFNIEDLADDKWSAQSKFVWALHEMANDLHIHIAFVAHPRKSSSFLRFDDISGTADLQNAVEYGFLVHRMNEDFKRLYEQTYKQKPKDKFGTATNFVEVAKDRDYGTQDLFVPMYYEIESKRIKNTPTENKHYGWLKMDASAEKKANAAVQTSEPPKEDKPTEADKEDKKKDKEADEGFMKLPEDAETPFD